MTASEARNRPYGWRWTILLLMVLGLPASAVGADRTVRAMDASLAREGTNCLSIVLEARGGENALGFSLCYDTNQLIFLSARRGSAAGGATLNVNANQATRGRVGCALALPP